MELSSAGQKDAIANGMAECCSAHGSNSHWDSTISSQSCFSAYIYEQLINQTYSKNTLCEPE